MMNSDVDVSRPNINGRLTSPSSYNHILQSPTEIRAYGQKCGRSLAQREYCLSKADEYEYMAERWIAHGNEHLAKNCNEVAAEFRKIAGGCHG